MSTNKETEAEKLIRFKTGDIIEYKNEFWMIKHHRIHNDQNQYLIQPLRYIQTKEFNSDIDFVEVYESQIK